MKKTLQIAFPGGPERPGCGDRYACPVALALQREYPYGTTIAVHPTVVTIRTANGRGDIPLPAWLVGTIAEYDNAEGHPDFEARTVSWEVDLPELDCELVREFPASTIGYVTQGGTNLVPRQQGVKVTLKFANRLNDGTWIPHCAEVESLNPAPEGEEELYAEMGLEWLGKTLTGYDGVMDCPSEVLTMLKELGYDVSDVEETEEVA